MRYREHLYNKHIRLAIEYHLPMYWQPRYSELELRVVTYTSEIGHDRTRRVYRCQFGEALEMSQDLLRVSRAHLNVEELVRPKYDVWLYGWDSRMLEQQTSLREFVDRYVPPNPDWLGWLLHRKENIAERLKLNSEGDV